ncbi:hypothetical protein [Vibrio alfacsensis]|uniref:hypothetical protein n=2 Tax=Vibrio TaxID=662 RepID=UPI00078B5E94|nr:hypothetical protein [Vibrio alfacsensis]BAU70805.1 hypothetical protein [Vibrio sp. 04Ya108]BBM67627.1 hypothetical protein VA249_42730 [Vibrio alfacsensis]BCN27109.1 hypothetical protein VYA_43010 [Vibrio alfacsensis]
MRFLYVFIFALVVALTGCSSNSGHMFERDLSSSWVKENYIPYPNSPYQRERPVITMKEVSSDSDFVVVETTMQYVIWKKDPVTITLDEAKSLVGTVDNVTATDELFIGDTDNMPVDGLECRPIINDAGSIIGEVKVCEGQFCVETDTERYACDSRTCQIKTDLNNACSDDPKSHPFCETNPDVNTTCKAFPELIMCSKASMVCGQNLDK